MSDTSIRIAAIDDDPDFEPVLQLCVDHVRGMSLDLRFYCDEVQAQRGIERAGADVILLDYQLGQTSGLEVLKRLRAQGLEQPVVALTGRGGTSVAVELMKAGASDYISKTDLSPDVLHRALFAALREHQQERELQRNRRALAESEQRLRAVLQNAWDAIVVTDGAGTIASANRAAHAIFGFKQGSLSEVALRELLPGPAGEAHQPDFDWRSLVGRPREWEGRTRSGGRIQVEMSLAHVELPDRELITVIVRDITQRKLAEERLAQTLEALEQSRDDLLSVLQQLQLGAAITDEWGNVVYLNSAAQRLLDVTLERARDRHWERLWEVKRDEVEALRAMWAQPENARARVAIELAVDGRRPRRVEVDFRNDPRDPKRRVLFIYDVSEAHDLRQQLDGKARFDHLVGRSGVMQTVYQTITDVSSFDATVLVVGETGTGKELVAQAIHNASPRKDKPFVAVNTAGLSDSLLASQLFGHVRGAFTGAHEDRKGVFESAEGGTIFLDEIGDISPSVQTSLLRVLQEREITRVGEALPRPINVRVIAATHRDLLKEVGEGRFRMDLLYRVRVASIELPPLRARREDIPLLAREFLRQARVSTGKAVADISEDAMRSLVAYDWPGNVRELKSAIEFGVIRCRGEKLRAEELAPEICAAPHQSAGQPEPPALAVLPRSGLNDDARRERILEALRRADGNRSAAARLLGVSRATFYRHLERLGMATSD